MNFKNRVIGIQKWIDKKYYREENRFNKEKLFEQEYLNFQIDDCYNYMENVVGETRDDIFKILFSTYSQWKIELNKLNIPFYLGVWIYNPRLPKSEIVCAIGKEKIEYYQNKCFDVSNEQKNIIDLKNFEKEKDTLIWTKKIDFDTLEDWEINFPKENYENEQHWLEYQEHFKNFINNSYKVDKNENGNRYYKNVGEIWTGELIRK
ncbi:hypothetical protein [Bizionia sp.]|uniref:hypothetical protein n=1 Tax=Bizionia sp. TaxID=1954480 RepID=UPI003A956209